MRRSLGAAIRLFLRWEPWALVGVAVVSRLAGGWLWPVFGGSTLRIFGAYSFFGLFVTALSCGVLAASMVLLLPLSRGKPGLDFRFLSRHVSTALAGGAIMMGTQLPLSILSQYGAGSIPGWMQNYVGPVQWIVVDISALFCAWYIHGKGEEERGRRPPGSWQSLKAGLVAGILGLWMPGVALRTGLETLMPWSMDRYPYAIATFAYLLGVGAIPLFSTAWFYGALGEGRTGEPTA